MLLEVQDLTCSFGDSLILNGLSLRVERGEVVTLIGPNGAGKSTLLKKIMNIDDTIAATGSILFKGRSIMQDKTSHIIGQGVSYIPQGNAVFLSLTVEENLRIAFYHAGNGDMYLGEVYQRFPILAAKKKATAAALSGGERQLLGLGRALVTRPELLLLDEPTASLAPKPSKEVFDRIKALQNEGTSIILVEQRVKPAVAVADRVYILKAGTVFFSGGSDDVNLRRHLQKAYLGG